MPYFSILIVLFSLSFGCKHPAPVVSTTQDLSAAPKGRTYNEYGDYLIDVNDQLSIFVQGSKDLNGSYRVSPSGYIAVPLAGMVRAKGLSEMQLRDSLVLKLRPHMAVPRVSVAVTDTSSNIVYFSGFVQKPGTYQLNGRTTLLQGLSLAGGWQGEQAKRIIILRESPEGVKKRYESSLEGIRSGNSFIDNFRLERGDLVIVE